MNKAQGAIVYRMKDGRQLTESNMFSASGELNAQSKQDAFAQQRRIQDMMARGEITASYEDDKTASMSAAERSERTRERNALFIEATNDSQKWASLGSSIVAKIEDRADRSSLFSNLLIQGNVRQGEVPRVELKQHVCQGIVASSPTDIGYQVLRGRVFTPPEFQIKSNVRVSMLDIYQISGDLMDRAQNDAQQAMIVNKDRLLMAAFDKSIGRGNPLTQIFGKMTPDHLARQREAIDSWNIPVRGTVFSTDFWTDMISDPNWVEAMEPVTRYELMMSGRLATILGMELVTDGFRDPTQRVLKRGRMYTYADPEYLGAYTSRGVTIDPTTGANDGNTDKGWLLSEFISFIVAQTRAVAVAERK